MTGRLAVHETPLLKQLYLYPAGAEYGTERVIASVLQQPDARRLAACWNACDGVPTEKVESYNEAIGITVRAGAQKFSDLSAEIGRLTKVVLDANIELGEARANAGMLKSKHLDTMQERNNLAAELAAARVENSRLARELATALCAVPKDGTGDYAAIVRDLAEGVVHVAGIMGQVVTVSQRPLHPYAMGNYETVVDVRPARELAK